MTGTSESPTTPSTKKRCAILGATGTVGQKFILLLQDHSSFELVAIGASERSEGKQYKDACTWKQQSPCPTDVVFSALPTEAADRCEKELASMGKKVFSNASSHRMDPDVPLLLPLVNGPHVHLVKSQPEFKSTGGFIITNSNCAAVGLCTALKVLEGAIGPITKVHASTMQAISGAGYPGIPSLDILGNVVPNIGGEEDKIEQECPKILGTLDENQLIIQPHGMTISTMVHRVPVIDGHTVSMSIEFASELSKDDIVARCTEVLSSYQSPDPLIKACPSAPAKPVEYRIEPNRPQPLLDVWAGAGYTTVCGRVRTCKLHQIRIVTLAHNTVIGAAGGSVLNAEYALAAGLV